MKANAVHAPEVPTVSAPDLLAFALEVAAVSALATWGWRAGGWAGAAAAVTAFAVVWVTFLSPRAALPATGVLWPVGKVAVFTLSAAAVHAVAGPSAAAAFLGLAAVNVLLGGTR